MCDPTVMLVLMAAQAGVSVAQQKQQQKETIKLQENQADSLVKDYNYQQKNLENESISQQDSVEDELFNSTIEAAKVRASVVANSGSTGITGNTLSAIDSDLNATVGRQQNTINTNYDIFKQSSQSASDANYLSLTSALTGLSGGVSGPGFLDSALKIGGAAAGGYAAGGGLGTKK